MPWMAITLADLKFNPEQDFFTLIKIRVNLRWY